MAWQRHGFHHRVDRRDEGSYAGCGVQEHSGQGSQSLVFGSCSAGSRGRFRISPVRDCWKDRRRGCGKTHCNRQKACPDSESRTSSACPFHRHSTGLNYLSLCADVTYRKLVIEITWTGLISLFSERGIRSATRRRLSSHIHVELSHLTGFCSTRGLRQRFKRN